jgi:hypothetical protein
VVKAAVEPEPPSTPLTLELVEGSWAAIVEQIAQTKRAVWTALAGTRVVALDADVMTIGFPALSSAEILKKPQGPGLPPNAELVREAIKHVTGHRVRFKVQELPPVVELEPVEAAETEQTPPEVVVSQDAAPVAGASEVASTVEPSEPSDASSASWPTITVPFSEPAIEEVGVDEPDPDTSIESVSEEPSRLSQVGEAVIREVLGGQLISEHRIDEPEEK